MPILRKLRFPVKKLMTFCKKKEKTDLLYSRRKGNLAKRNDLSSVFFRKFRLRIIYFKSINSILNTAYINLT